MNLSILQASDPVKILCRYV